MLIEPYICVSLTCFYIEVELHGGRICTNSTLLDTAKLNAVPTHSFISAVHSSSHFPHSTVITNLMCQLGSDVPNASTEVFGQTLFWTFLWRYFLDEINILISGL